MSGLTQDGTAEPVSRDQILRRESGQGNIDFPCSADHVQDWQPYLVDPYSCYVCYHTGQSYLLYVQVHLPLFPIQDMSGSRVKPFRRASLHTSVFCIFNWLYCTIKTKLTELLLFLLYNTYVSNFGNIT